MINKLRIITIISLAFWGFIISSAINNLYNIFNELNIFVLINQLNFIQKIYIIFISFIIFLFFILIELFIKFNITIIYFGIIIALKKFYKEKIKFDQDKNIKYYRNLIKNHSIGVLKYVKDFSVDNNTIVGTILSLQLKQKIKINNDIIVDNNIIIDDLDLNESYVLECLLKKEKIDLNLYTNYIIEDCKKQKLLTTKNNYRIKIKKRIKLFIDFIIFNFILLIPLLIYLNKNINTSPFMFELLSMIITICCFIIFLLVPIIFYVRTLIYKTMSALDPFIRNNAGNQLTQNLIGLENFLKDFSKMDEKVKNDLIIWKEYLIYAVIFKQNNKIKSEIYNIAKNILP